MGRTAPNEDLLVVHGYVPHGKDSFGPRPAHNEVHLVAGEEQLHGIDGVRHVQQLIGICLDELNFSFSLANSNASFGIDLLSSHGSSVPMPLALHKVHGAYYADLNRLGPPGRRTDCHTKERRQQNAQKKMKLFHDILFPFQDWQRFARFKKPVSQVKLLSRMSG